MSSEYLYKNIEFNINIAKDIIPVILLKNSTLKREKIIESVYLYHILNGGLKSEGNEKYSIINALTELKEKGVVEQPNLGYYKLTETYQNKIKLGEDNLIKLPFDKKVSKDIEVNVEDLETELKNLSFELLKTLPLDDRKILYKNIIKLPFDKKVSKDIEVNVEDLETELKNLSFELLKTLPLDDRKILYKNILEKFELKAYQENSYENKKHIIEKVKLLLETL